MSAKCASCGEHYDDGYTEEEPWDHTYHGLSCGEARG